MKPCYDLPERTLPMSRSSCADSSCGQQRDRLVTENIESGSIHSPYDCTVLIPGNNPNPVFYIESPGNRVKYVYNNTGTTVTIITNGNILIGGVAPPQLSGTPHASVTLVPIAGRWVAFYDQGFTAPV